MPICHQKLSRSAALVVFLLALGSSPFLRAQSSANGGPAPAAVPGSVSVWPSAASLRPGVNLLVTTNKNYGGAYDCKLQSLDDRSISCHGPHHRPVVYERSMVQTISFRTQRLRNAFVIVVIGSAVLVGGSIACGFAGAGLGCAVMAAVGLSGSLVASILHSIDQFRRPGEPTPIYIAPTPANPALAAN